VQYVAAMTRSSLMLTALLSAACASAPKPAPSRGERREPPRDERHESPRAERREPARPGYGRAELLAKVDAALASRDGAALASLTDWSGWEERREKPVLVLPEAPIHRAKELSETEILYRDATARPWRLVLRRAGGGFLVVPRARPCPRGGMERAPIGDAAPPARAEEKPDTWTPLECWPLPQ
jgi:hypothetical protein